MKSITTTILLLLVSLSYAQNISTIVGIGNLDGNPALNVSINATGCTVDAAGNILIADGKHDRIRKVTPTGVITTIAGLGFSIGNYTQAPGYTGDGGPALNAHLESPKKVITDPSGNIYVAQSNCVRKIAVNGIITTVAGNCNTSGYSGDGGLATSALIGVFDFKMDNGGNMYLCDKFSHRIRKIDAATQVITTIAGVPGGGFYGGYSGDDGPATSAQFAQPEAVAVDNDGNVYIADNGNHRIRKVAKSTGIVTTVASYNVSNEASPFSPNSLAFDRSGNLLFGDFGKIIRINANGTLTKIAGMGGNSYGGDGVPALNAYFSSISDLFVDANNNILIADGGYVASGFDNYIRRITPDNIIRTVVGNGTRFYGGDGYAASVAQLFEPTGVAVDRNNNILIADWRNYTVRKVSPSGIITTIAGIKPSNANSNGSFGGDNGPATQAQFANPRALAVDNSNAIYLVDNHRIRKIDTDGIIRTIAGTDTFPFSGGYAGDGGPAISARINTPLSVAVDAAGSVYIADAANHRVRKITPDGIINTVAGNGTSGFTGDGGPATAARIKYPTGVAVDASGNIYIACEYRLRKVNQATGIITTIAGTGEDGIGTYGDGGPATSAQISPYSCAVDNQGNVYIVGGSNVVYAQMDDNLVRKISPNGIITTVAGTGYSGYQGDGGPATSAKLGSPISVAIDADGNLLIAERSNCRIRKVTYGTINTYTFTGNGNWNVSSNWLNSTMPPQFLPSGKRIIIAPATNGECILNVPQTISAGGFISVNGKLKMANNLLFSQ
ncbi:hypothetical protein GCM10028807_47400 [Spirosoma daeguense]